MRTLIALAALGLCQGCVSSSSSGRAAVPTEDAAVANLNLGAAYLRQGRPEVALVNLQKALEFNPRLGAAHSAIAIVYEQLGEAEEAERHYLRATQLDPNDGSAANSYAVFLCRDDRWPEAERFFRRAADNVRYLTPAAALTNAGVCARGAGDLATAERYFREGLSRDAAFPDALYNMADMTFQTEDYLAARAFTQRYLAAAGGTAEVLLLCVQVEQALDASDAAAQCATRLRNSFPDSDEVARLNAIERNEPR